MKYNSFESKCSHVFLKDAVDNTFTVLTQNHPDCFNGQEPEKCYKIVKLFVQDKQYFLKRSGKSFIKPKIDFFISYICTDKGYPIFASTKKVLPIPGQLPGIRITIVGNYVVLSLDALGLVLKWDGKQQLQVQVWI